MEPQGNEPEKKVNSDQPIKVIELLTPILLLPTIVLAGYLVAFLHEIGYTSRFGVPIGLIRIDSTSMMTSLPPVLLLVFLLLLGVTELAVVNWVNRKLLALKNPSSIRLLLWWAWFNVIVTTSVIYSAIKGDLGNQSTYIGIGLLIFELIPFVVSLPIYKTSSGSDPNADLDKDIPKFWKFYTKPSVLLILVPFGLFALSLLAYEGGFVDAISTKSYLVPSSPTNSVVLRIYGDDAICATVNQNNQIERSYFVLNLNEPNLILTAHQYDAPLTVAPVVTEKIYKYILN